MYDEFDEQFKIVKAVKSADASVSLEGGKNNLHDLTIINEAWRRSMNNGSLFNELVNMYEEQRAKLREKEEMSYGNK